MLAARAAVRFAATTLGVALALAAATATADDLSARLTRAIGSKALRGASVAVLVVDAADGRVRFAHRADRAQIPASNMKIFTAVAALQVFGPAHRFQTEVLADAEPGADGEVDRLGVRGGGDPALSSEQLWRLAADLRTLGLRRVGKGLRLDASAFDDQRWHPTWGAISSRAYNAPIAGLTANYGAYGVTVTPGARAGAPARVEIDPPVAYLRLVDSVRTIAGSKTGLSVDRRAADGHEEVVVSGTVRAGGSPVVNYRSVLDPVRYAGSLLRLQLEANGIAVGGATEEGPLPGDWVVLHRFEGKPMSEVVALFLKYSNNSIGETLVKAIGARRSGGAGSWDAGMAGVKATLADLGISLDGLVMRDGSGLSYENRVTARALVDALRIADASFRFGPEFVAALPIAAADGTLEKRVGAAPSRIRAKTGLLTRVTSLSGYADGPEGRLVFAILVNGFRSSASAAMKAVDGIATELIR